MSLRSLADALAFSSLLASAIGFALSAVASLALGAPDPLHWAGLAGTGTFIIYSLDRLRDTAQDRSTSPQRTAFIEGHRRALVGAVGIAALAFGAMLLHAPRSIALLCAGIGLVGLWHRRLKGAAVWNVLYVALAWVAACVGMPWIAAGRPSTGPWVAGLLFAILIANLIASGLRDDEGALISHARARTGLRIATGAALLALGLAWIAPARIAPIGWIALAEVLAVQGFRDSERYGLLVVDGALLLGSVAAVFHLALLG